MGGSLAFPFSCVSHISGSSQGSHQTSDPTHPGDPGGSGAPRSSDGSRADSTCSLQAAPTLGIHQRAPRRPSTKRGSAQPITSAFPFLPSPNLAHGCCRRSKINQPRVIHRCLLSLSLTSTSCLSAGCA